MLDIIAVGFKNYIYLCQQSLRISSFSRSNLQKSQTKNIGNKQNNQPKQNKLKQSSFYSTNKHQNKVVAYHLSEKSQKIIFRLLMRSFTDQKFNKVALEQWSSLFGQFFNYLRQKYLKEQYFSTKPSSSVSLINQMIEECLQYIAGSFSMNTPPQRRRIAFQMMKGLVEHSQKAKQRAKTKAAFFNNDTNSKTRVVICQVMGKLLLLNPNDQQIRKYILDYFNDQNWQVKQKAFYIMIQISHQKHVDAIFNCLIADAQSSQDNKLRQKSILFNNLFIENLENILTRQVSAYIRKNKLYKMTLLNKINFILKCYKYNNNANVKNNSNSMVYREQFAKVFPILDKIYILLQGIEQNMQNNPKIASFLDMFILDQIDFQNQQCFKSLLILYKNVQQNLQLKKQSAQTASRKQSLQIVEQIQQKYNQRDDQSLLSFNHPVYKEIFNFLAFYVYKYLTKSNKIKAYFIKSIENIKFYFSVFTFNTEEQNMIYINTLIKLCQQSKWSLINHLLQPQILSKISIVNEPNYQKISQCLTKLIMNCSYNLIEPISKSILFLMLNKRKLLVDLFLSIKQKLLTSKNWIHRKNYIILYAEVKAGSSYEFHKIIPILNYRVITKEKSIGLKLQFLKYSIKIYESLDPNSQQKVLLKQAVNELASSAEKDQDILQKAKQVLQKLKDIDSTSLYFPQKKVQRNNVFLQQQQKMRQRQALMVNNIKKTKTQKQLGRKDSKSKTITIQSRSSLRVPPTNSNNMSFNTNNISKDIIVIPPYSHGNKQGVGQMKKQNHLINLQKLTKRPSTTANSNKNRSLPKSQDEKKQSTTSGSNTHHANHSASSSTMNRYLSGQMKNGSKVTTLKRQSGIGKK